MRHHALVAMALCLGLAAQASTYKSLMVDSETRACPQAVRFIAALAADSSPLESQAGAQAKAAAAIAHADAADSPLAASIAAAQTALSGLTQTVATKVDKVEGKQLSSEDFTAAEKSKLASLVANYRGLHPSGSALAASVSDAAAGDWAIVSGTDTVWIWDADTLAWLDSGSVSVPSTWPGITGDVAESAALVAYLSTNYVPDTTLAEWVDSLRDEISAVAPEGYAAVLAHVSDTANPHDVSKAQIGLGDVDNTSDANKPISTATQSALDNKLDASKLPVAESAADDMKTIRSRYSLDDNTLLLLHFDGDVADASNYARTGANSGTTSDASDKVFGSASRAFNGSSWISYSPSSAFAFGEGAFTVELCFRPTSFPSISALMSCGGTRSAVSNYNGWDLSLANSNSILFTSWGGTTVNLSGACSLTANVWHHLAVVRDPVAGAMKIYLDGVLIGSVSGAFTFPAVQSTLKIGTTTENVRSFYGSIDEVRISNVARYTAAFTPPTAAFAAERYNELGVIPLDKSLNLSDLTDTAAARDHLGVTAIFNTFPSATITTKTASDTAALVDAGTLVRFVPPAAALTYTIPLNAVVAFSTNAQIDVALANDTDVVIQAATGVTLNGVTGGGRRLSAAYTGATLRKVSADAWEIYGAGVDE